MNYYIGEAGSSGMKFDNITDFLNVIAEIASTYEENGEDWFEIEIIND